MKIVILCGGLGSRLGVETKLLPKPMVKLDREPILIHILKIAFDIEFDPNQLLQQVDTIQTSCNELLESLIRA